ncbi:MAG: hypothetical protein K9G58_03535 [Bacteroidales bacterium]|nr:hypothetical protein [Bacteroidales bacterium]MCF8386712.1 hypothetical protein [Bacteroidales bacterium]MCF8397215.1 hypothetical protein [Bacteroidales bacterium]
MQKFLAFLSNWLLRLGVIAFFIPILIEYWKNPGFEEEAWFWTARIVYVLIFLLIVIICIVLNRLKFYNYGFSLVFVASLYTIVDTYYKYGITEKHAVYFLILVASFYFMTKTERLKKRRGFK